MNPDKAPDIELQTFPQMVATVRATFLSTTTSSESEAEDRAHLAVSRLIDWGLVEWWGLTPEGLYLYGPTQKKVVVYERSPK